MAFKTQLCRGFFTNNGYCSYGDDCSFAHRIEELRVRPVSPNLLRRLNSD